VKLANTRPCRAGYALAGFNQLLVSGGFSWMGRAFGFPWCRSRLV